MKMEFVIEGFHKVQGVMLERTGIFGYYLFK